MPGNFRKCVRVGVGGGGGRGEERTVGYILPHFTQYIEKDRKHINLRNSTKINTTTWIYFHCNTAFWVKDIGTWALGRNDTIQMWRLYNLK